MIWTTVCDLQGSDGDVIMTYEVYFMPTYFLIDPEGVIVDKFLGTGQLDEKLGENRKTVMITERRIIEGMNRFLKDPEIDRYRKNQTYTNPDADE